MCTLSKNKSEAMLAEASLIGKPQIKADETMTFDYFLESQKIIHRYVTEFMAEGKNKRREARLALLGEPGYD